MGTPVAVRANIVPPPAAPLVAPPIQGQVETRTVQTEQKGSVDKSRFPMVLAIVGGVGAITVTAMLFAAVLAMMVLRTPSSPTEKEDIVTELQLSDAERSQAELEQTKAANRMMQNDILQLESQSRALDNELMQLRKSVL